MSEGRRIHYFPPNPEKIGDNLLTFDIPWALAGECEVLHYYAAAVVCEVLARFSVGNIEWSPVSDLGSSCELAFRARAAGLDVVDLQRLNCFVDYPEYRHLFGEDLPERARYDWQDPVARASWGVRPFGQIFREMLDLPPGTGLQPTLRCRRTHSATILLFPHCGTDLQQHEFWPGIWEVARQRGSVLVIGRAVVRELAPWAPDTRFCCDQEGGRLVDLIGSARVCLGAATGLTHIACELGVPTLAFWKHDDLEVFRPRRRAGSEFVVLADSQAALARQLCRAFLRARLGPPGGPQ